MNCLSITYKTVPIQVRELFAFSKEDREKFMKHLLTSKIVTECVIVSTCNRSELYFDGNGATVYEVQLELGKFKDIPLQEVIKYMYCYHGESAIRHLYKVAAGMDSMVIGEDEILGQLKEAFFYSRDNQATGFYLNTVFQGAITCAKRIKTDTNLSKIPVSIGTLVAREVFGFEKSGDKNVLIIGITGKMGTIVSKNLSGKNNVHVTGTFRSHHVTKKLMDDSIKQIDYNRRYEAMDEADIIVSVTTSPHYTITYEELKNVIVTKKKRIFIDLSVPLDIDKEITKLDDVVLYDIDYFTKLSKENNESKQKELIAAEELLEDYIGEIKKTIDFHMFLEYLPRVKEVFKKNTPEQILYKLRDQSTSEEFEAILQGLSKL